MDAPERGRPTPAFARLPGFRYGLAVLAVAAATALFIPGRDLFAKGQWGLLYLLVTAVVAYFADARAAVLAAVLSFLAWDYFFLPPFGRLALADVKDVVTLVVFLAIAVVLGLRTAGLRASEAAAHAREREARELGGLASALLSAEGTDEMSDLALDVVDRLFEPREAAVFTLGAAGGLEARWRRGAPDVRAGIGAAAASAAAGDTADEPAGAGGGLLVPLRSDGATLGVIYVGPAAHGARVAALARSLAAVVTAFLGRMRMRDTLAQAQAEREADRLRAAIVSSVSHELKTPLASATTAVTGLLMGDAADDPARVRTELAAAARDLGRLEGSIGDLLDVSRLESSSWKASLERYTPGEIIGSALEGLGPEQSARIELAVPEDLAEVVVDLRQMARALRNVIDNSLAYADEGRVLVSAAEAADVVRFEVTDEGPGVPEPDRVMVFDKSYRGSAVTPGSGMGLAITKEVVSLHGGRVWIEPVQPHGARVVMELPREHA